MWRRGRGQPVVEHEGDLVIHGRVHARLLRVPLLDIDAHVVVTPARPALGSGHRARLPPGRRPITTTATMDPEPGGANQDGDGGSRHRSAPASRPRPVAGLARPARLARADDLIAESASLLDEASRIR
jgi:hypothetical protein